MTQLEENLKILSKTSYLFAYKNFDMGGNDPLPKSYEHHPNDVMLDIITLFKGFYALQMLEACATPDEFLASHARWKEDFNHFKTWYYNTLAQMIYDYSVLSCFGELRHTHEQCECTINHSYFFERTSCARSEFVKDMNIPFTAKSIIHIAKILFGECCWSNGYGGDKWCDIANAQDLYVKGQEAVYIDHCVDLEHNNGTYFNKELIFFVDSYYGGLHDYLDFKYEAKPEELYMTCTIRPIQELILRANNLGIITPLSKYFHFYSDERNKIHRYCSHSYLHTFFPRPLKSNQYEDMSVVDVMKLYNPYHFGREILTSRNIIRSATWMGGHNYKLKEA